MQPDVSRRPLFGRPGPIISTVENSHKATIRCTRIVSEVVAPWHIAMPVVGPSTASIVESKIVAICG